MALLPLHITTLLDNLKYSKLFKMMYLFCALIDYAYIVYIIQVRVRLKRTPLPTDSRNVSNDSILNYFLTKSRIHATLSSDKLTNTHNYKKNTKIEFINSHDFCNVA